MFQNDTDKAHDPAARQGERRSSVRYDHAERITLATQWGSLAGSLLDISAEGAQMRLANGLVPLGGDEVRLRLVDGPELAGSVVWADRDRLGLAFAEALPAVEDVLWLEQRAPEWFYASVRAQCR